MIEYATSTHCRNRMLFEIFRGNKYQNCQRCDVCLHKHDSGLNLGEFENIRTALHTLLADGQPHSASIITDLPFPENKVKEAVTYLIREEEIKLQDGLFVLDLPSSRKRFIIASASELPLKFFRALSLNRPKEFGKRAND